MNKIKFAAVAAALACVNASADEIKDVLSRYTSTGCIAGVVSATSDDGYNVKMHCVGWADAEKKIPMREDTLFAVFSMTKTFTGIALLAAVDEGKISLDDKVSKYLPEFADIKMKDGSKVKRAVTVRDLMNHTTGWRGGERVINRSIPLREVARKLAALPLSYQPGETFSYGNAWVCSAAACLEVATHESFEGYLKRKIFDPLGMKDTTFTPDVNQISRLVKPYTSDAYAFRPAADGCCAQLQFPKKEKVYPAASGGLFSTPRDMIAFAQMLAHHGDWKGTCIVSRKTFDSLFAVKQTPADIKEPYTVGAWIWGDWIGHEGAMRTDQRANLKTGHCRVFFIQTENAAGPAFFQLKTEWNRACDIEQNTPLTVFGT